MKKIYLTLGILFLIVTLFAQNTTVSFWQRTLETCDVSEENLKSVCPNFPNFDASLSEEQFTKLIKNWESQFPKEVESFWSLEKIVESNPSAYYLGLEIPNEEGYTNSFNQWVVVGGISETRLKVIAPNYPTQVEGEELDMAIERWMFLYGHEYERLLNDKQLTALNPYYDGYVEISPIPKFISALISEEKPELIDTKNPKEDQLRLELQIQNWYFVFHPDQFKGVYGFFPTFPEWFDVEDYRQQIKDKIKANEEAKAAGKTDPNENK